MAAPTQVLLAGGDVLRLVSTNVIRVVPGGPASASFRLDADGRVYVTNASGVLTAQYSWVTPNDAAPNYDVRWNTTVGTVDTTPGAENTNLSLGSDRTWTETVGATMETATFEVRIHRAGDTTNPLQSATITLEVDGSP